MKTHTAEELKTILENHRHWIDEDCEGWEDMRADLRGADLYGADLRGANLYGADLRRANLSGANLSGANLIGANLIGADLSRADLRRANLIGANLIGADLIGANLIGADLSRANLSRANLSGANLSGANLSGADLYGANLSEANLSGANLYGAYLSGAKNVPYIPMACPDSGSFIGWKKAHLMGNTSVRVIVKLEIPGDARRLSATGRKCRCDKAKVLAVEAIDGKSGYDAAISNRDAKFAYKVGEEVSVEDFDEDRWEECSAGIHFFINRQEAVDYQI